MKTLNLAKTPRAEIISQATTALKAGGLIIFPTETVYGAGVDATNPQAVKKLLAYKSRREGKPLSIAVSNQKMAEEYVELNQQAKKIYERFLPGPVTVVSKSRGRVAPGVASEFETLGVRIPDYELILDLVAALGKPITATSANASGKKRPYTLDDIWQNLSGKQEKLVDLALDAGQLPPNDPSSVIETTLSTPTTLRAGKISQTNAAEFADEASEQALISSSEAETQKIAGTLMLKNWEKLKKQGLVIGLDGKLGAGKTIFAKGVAKFLKIREKITSPTYSYIEEYEYQRHGVKGNLYHLDLWKIENEAELERLEIEELLGKKNVVVIEWWEQGRRALQKKTDLQILIEEKNDKSRKMTIKKS